MTNKTRRPGRRPGESDTRAAILDAARRLFIDEGFRGATTRKIAAAAGVDAALISYFFGSKQNLFGEAFALPANPATLVAARLDGPIDELPHRLLAVLLDTWDPVANRPSLLAIAQAAGSPETASLTRGFVEEVLLGPIAARLRAEGVRKRDATRCSGLLVTQLVGVIYTRYVLAVADVAAIPKASFLAGYVTALTQILRQYVPVDR